MEEINLENRRRGSAEAAAEGGGGAQVPDFIPWDTGMNLPYLPYSFTCTCALCGKVGILPDNKGTMPLLFLRQLLQDAFAKTPFVFNVLYQMAFFLDLEKQQAQRWQDVHGGKTISLHMRGRVTFCLPCSRYHVVCCWCLACRSVSETQVREGEGGAARGIFQQHFFRRRPAQGTGQRHGRDLGHLEGAGVVLGRRTRRLVHAGSSGLWQVV